MKSSKILFALSFVVIGVVFYAWDCHNMFINDDVFYAFFCEIPKRIESFSDVFRSQIDHYFFRNGRFLIHCIVQMFCAIWGLKAFYVVNTIVFLFFLYIVYWYILQRTKNDSALLSITLLSLLLFLPQWKYTIIGYVSGAVNYLWCALFYMFFIIFYENERKKQRSVNTLYKIAFFLLSLIVGSLQESFCIGISGYFLYYYFINPKLFKGSVIPIVIGFLIGSAIVVAAPGNLVRVEREIPDTFILLRFVKNFLFLFGGGGKVLVIFVGTIILMWFKKRDLLISFYKEYELLFFVMFFNILFLVFIAFSNYRQLMSINLYAIILLVILLYQFYGYFITKYHLVINFLIIVFLIYSSIHIYNDRKDISNAYNELWENARVAKNGIVVDEKYDSILTTKNNWYTKKFTRRQYLGDFERLWMGYYFTDGKDAQHCKVVLPDKPDVIVNYCVPEFQVSKDVYKPKNKNYYVIVTHGGSSSAKTIHIVSESYPKDAIVNKIKTGSPNTVQNIPLSTIIDYFTLEKNTYYIYRDIQDMKALSVELRMEES